MDAPVIQSGGVDLKFECGCSISFGVYRSDVGYQVSKCMDHEGKEIGCLPSMVLKEVD